MRYLCAISSKAMQLLLLFSFNNSITANVWLHCDKTELHMLVLQQIMLFTVFFKSGNQYWFCKTPAEAEQAFDCENCHMRHWLLLAVDDSWSVLDDWKTNLETETRVSRSTTVVQLVCCVDVSQDHLVGRCACRHGQQGYCSTIRYLSQCLHVPDSWQCVNVNWQNNTVLATLNLCSSNSNGKKNNDNNSNVCIVSVCFTTLCI